ncbi:MAG: hypothetical protein ACE5EL_06055, partial [Anaerolineae bacterium]
AVAAVLVATRVVAGRSPLGKTAAAAAGAGTYRFRGTSGYEVAGRRHSLGLQGSGTAFVSLTLRATVPGSPVVAVAWPTVTDQTGRLLPARSIAPLAAGGDLLGLVAAGHAPVVAGMEPVGDRLCRRVDFLVAGRAYLEWWRRHPGVFPVNADAGGLAKFTAQGSLWQDPTTNLPCRLRAHLDLPRLAGPQPGRAWVDWTYDWQG